MLPTPLSSPAHAPAGQRRARLGACHEPLLRHSYECYGGSASSPSPALSPLFFPYAFSHAWHLQTVVRDFARSSSFQHRLTCAPVPSHRPSPPAAARRLPSLPALRYCLICAAAAQAFSVSFNASHLLPPLIDLMQDPVVNVRLKVAPAPAFHGSPTTSSRDAAGVRYGPRRLHNCSARLCGGCRGGVQARPRQGSSFMVPEPCPSLPALRLTSRLHAQLRRGQGQGSQRLCARHVQGSRSVVTFLLLFFV